MTAPQLEKTIIWPLKSRSKFESARIRLASQCGRPGMTWSLPRAFYLPKVSCSGAEQIVALENATNDDDGKRGNVVRAEVAAEVLPDFDKLRRHFFAASSCGICGKASIDAVRSRLLRTPNPNFRVEPKLIVSLPDALRSAQDVFERTGGLHAAALFDARGHLLIVREDIGRHNAVDKVIGWALLNDRIPLSDCILLVSGRGGFEIIQKAIVAGIPVVASVSAPSSLAVQLARELRLTLIGFLRGTRFVVYAGEDRVAKS